MIRVRREWTLLDLLQQFPELQCGASFVLRCKSTTIGHGRYVKEISEKRDFAEVAVEVSPADSLSVSLGHDWPAAIVSADVTELDRALLHGIVAEMAQIADLALWGCRIRSTSAMHSEHTTPLGVTAAAALAVRDMMSKADWTPESPTSLDAA